MTEHKNDKFYNTFNILTVDDRLYILQFSDLFPKCDGILLSLSQLASCRLGLCQLLPQQLVVVKLSAVQCFQAPIHDTSQVTTTTNKRCSSQGQDHTSGGYQSESKSLQL